MHRLASLAVLAVCAATLPIPAQFEDCMWYAGRQGRKLTKINAAGEVLASADLSGNGLDLSRVARMPDGRLWVINFITTRMTICDRNGGNPQNIDTSSIDGARGATEIVFDRTGIAWVTFNWVGVVARFAPNGAHLNTIPVGGSGTAPLGITIDNQGNVWVGHRRGPPSSITKIDPTTFATTSYSLPAGTTTLGGSVFADSPGLVGNSKIWVTGDGSNEVVTFDSNGNHLATYRIGSNATAGVTNVTQDSAGNIWCVHFRSGTLTGDVFCLDRNNGNVLQTFTDMPEPIGVATDSFGRPWYLNRISFSGPQESQARRVDRAAATGGFEVYPEIGVGAYNASDPNGMHRASVILPLGDFDGDTAANLIEFQRGSSPYDKQSTPNLTLLSGGVTSLGKTARLDLRGLQGPAFLAFASGPTVSISIPGIIGDLRLAPASFLFEIPVTMPMSMPIVIPNDPTIAGYVLRMQALRVGPPFELSNDTSIRVFN